MGGIFQQAIQGIAIPVVGGPNDPWANAVTEAIEEGTGVRGPDDMRWVRIRDLTDAGFIKYLNEQEVTITRPTEVPPDVSTYELPLPPTDLVLISSDDPTRLNAFSHHLTWTVPSDETISHFEIWMSYTNSRSAANKLGIVNYPSNEFVYNNPKPGQNHYYWIRSVNWAGLYSTWEPSGVTNGFVIPKEDTLTETIDKILDVLQGEDPTLWSAATTYQIGDQVSYVGVDGSKRRYQCLFDENDVILNGKFDEAWAIGSEILTNQADRDFSSASNWRNSTTVPLSSYDESGDMSITASAVGQNAEYPLANVLKKYKWYRWELDCANIVGSWDFVGPDNEIYFTVTANGTDQTFDFFVQGDPTGTPWIRIMAVTPTSSADFDNFSVKPLHLDDWNDEVAITGYGFHRGYDVTTGLPKDNVEIDGSQTQAQQLYQPIATDSGDYYTMRFFVEARYAGQVRPYIGGLLGTYVTTTGWHSETLGPVSGSTDYMGIDVDSAFDGAVKYVQCRKTTGGTGNLNQPPEYYNKFNWERIGILTTGEIDGEAVTGIDGNMVVDGTILAKHIGVETLSALTADIGVITAGEIRSSNYSASQKTGFIIDLNNKIIRSHDAGAVIMEQGSDIVLKGDTSDPASIILEQPSGISFIIATDDTVFNRFWWYPSVNDTGQLGIGWGPDGAGGWERKRFETFYVTCEDGGSIEAYGTDTNDGYAQCQVTAATPLYPQVKLRAQGASIHDVRVNIGSVEFYGSGGGGSEPNLTPNDDGTKHKVGLVGLATSAWDVMYSDDFTNVADFFWMDDLDDVDLIQRIKPLEKDGELVRDPVTGLVIIDDNTVDERLLFKQKHTEYDILVDEFENKTKEKKWDKGDLVRDPDGKPYISFKAATSLLMGAIRQLDNRLKKLEGV